MSFLRPAAITAALVALVVFCSAPAANARGGHGGGHHGGHSGGSHSWGGYGGAATSGWTGSSSGSRSHGRSFGMGRGGRRGYGGGGYGNDSGMANSWGNGPQWGNSVGLARSGGGYGGGGGGTPHMLVQNYNWPNHSPDYSSASQSAWQQNTGLQQTEQQPIALPPIPASSQSAASSSGEVWRELLPQSK
ncbi:MAG: hypothetical protein ACRD3W_28055 [Terriglobales bacterium]